MGARGGDVRLRALATLAENPGPVSTCNFSSKGLRVLFCLLIHQTLTHTHKIKLNVNREREKGRENYTTL